MRPLRALACAVVVALLPSAIHAEEAAAEPSADDAEDVQAAEVAPAEPIDIEVHGDPRLPIEQRRDPTVPTFVLEAPALRAAAMDAASLLQRVPGVQLNRAGGRADHAALSLRGARASQVGVYLAGVRLNDELTGGVDLSTLPLWMLDRVEIYRGHAPADAGRAALGGAVLFEPSLPAGLHAQAALGMGSFGEREARVAGSIGDAKAAAAVGVRLSSADNDFGFVDDRGTSFDSADDRVRLRRNADHSDVDAWSLLRVDLPSLYLRGVFNAYRREAGAPGLQLPGALSARSAQQRWLAGISVAVPCTPQSQRGGCRLLSDTSALITRYRLDDPALELGLSPGSSSAGERMSQRLRVRTPIADEFVVTLGGSFQGQRLQVDSDVGTRRRANRQLLRTEASAGWQPHEDVTTHALLALECHSTASNEGSDTCGVLAPLARVGIHYRLLPWLSVLANIGRSVRVPTLGELYGVSATVRGNSELLPERGWSMDAGVNLSQRLGVWRGYLQAVGFTRFADQLIAYRRSSLGVVRPYNAAEARILGLEIASGMELFDFLQASLSLSLSDPRESRADGPDNDLLPLQARVTVAAGLEARSPACPAIALDDVRVGIRHFYRASRTADPAGLIVLPAQNLLEAEARLSFARQRLAFSFRAANLLDVATLDRLGYPLPGRSFHGLLESRW